MPSSIRKKGLSAVVNHLLDRKVADDDENEEDDDDSSSEEQDKLPSIPFDFLLSQSLLRLPLESAIRKEGLNTESAIELYYFPARLPPKKEGEGEVVPDWIMGMEFVNGVGGGSDGVLFTGGADGVVRSFQSNGGVLKSSTSIAAHTGPIHCISAATVNEKCLVATGSMDQTLVTHTYNHDGSLDLHAVYSGGHANTISSMALLANGGDGKSIMASGDWDGGLSLWSVPSADGNGVDGGDDRDGKKSKRRKGNSSTDNTTHASIQEVKPTISVKAHSSNISGLAWGYNNTSSDSTNSTPSTLLTGSWDHSLKVYDTSRMDCVLALNGSRVVTSLSRCVNSNVVGTGGPDCTVRLWDMRSGGSVGESVGSGADKTLRQR